jgi:pyruvate kinase
MNTWHRAKIVCTLGPATDAPGVLEALIGAGMDVARINFSHGTPEDHSRRIEAVRKAARELEQPVAVLADLPGPKFRLATLPENSRVLTEGESVVLSTHESGPATLPVRDPGLLAALRIGESVYLADGSVELRVTGAAPDRVCCEVLAAGTVRSGSGINVPEAELKGLVPTDEDREHLAFALSHAVEWIGVSFVQSPEDLARVRACFPEGEHVLLMAKIEKRRALADLEAIVMAADGVMVARGDLGVETDLAEIPLAQKRIIATARSCARPVVTATQMLESMVLHEHPTRAEVTDVANAVLDGTDAVMLSAETAVGRHPIAAVKMLSRVLTATEAAQAGDIVSSAAGVTAAPEGGDALSFAACDLAARLAAKAILVSVRALQAAAAIARFRPQAPLLVIADSEALYRSLAVIRGVAPIHSPEAGNVEACLDAARKWLIARGLAVRGDQALLLTASTRHGDESDTLRIVTL